MGQLHSTEWECGQWERHLIMKRITQVVLSKQFLLSNDDVVQIVGQLDFSLLHGSHDPISLSGSLMMAFEVLSNRFRSLDGLPSKISSVQPLKSCQSVALIGWASFKDIQCTAVGPSIQVYIYLSP